MKAIPSLVFYSKKSRRKWECDRMKKIGKEEGSCTASAECAAPWWRRKSKADLQHLVVQSWRFPVHTPCQFFIIRPQILFFSLISLNIDLFNVTSHLCFTRIFLGDRQLHEEIFKNENISWFQNHSSLSYGSCPFQSQTEWKLWRSVCNGISWIQEARIENVFIFANKDKNYFCLCQQRQKNFLSLWA